MKTILLTGGTGFLGSHLLKSFLQKNYHVILLKRSISHTVKIKNIINKVKSYDVDICSLNKIFIDNKIDFIIHAATNYGKNDESLLKVLKSNVYFPLELLELGKKNSVQYFFNVDSFFNNGKINYDYLQNYTLCKLQLEQCLKTFKGSPYIFNLKLHHLYGPLDSNSKFVNWLLSELILNKKEIKLTKGEQKRDFIFVNDVVDVINLLIQKADEIKKDDFLNINVATGNKITLAHFILTAKKIVSKCLRKKIKTQLNFGSIFYRENEIMDIDNDITFLKNLNWKSRYLLEDGLTKTVKSIIDKKEFF